MTVADVADRRLGQRIVTRIVLKRNNPTLLDTYGHWWVEIDDVESYGWWPAVRPVAITRALRGVPGVLNALGGPEGGGPTVDPRHGELADHAFHPLTDGDRTDDEVIAAIRRFATTFGGGWRWSIRATINCRSFQTDLLAAAGLAVPDGYTHTAGAGCPFLEAPRRWRNRLAHHRVNRSGPARRNRSATALARGTMRIARVRHIRSAM